MIDCYDEFVGHLISLYLLLMPLTAPTLADWQCAVKRIYVIFCVHMCAIYSVPETGDIMTQDQDQKLLLDEVESFCRRHGLADSKFGALTPINDTHLVDRMRSGMLRRSTMNKVRQFMARYELDSVA